MEQPWPPELVWWITVVELPALGGLLLLIWRNRREAYDGLETLRRALDLDLKRTREELAAYKVEVAQNYASIPALRDTEGRLTDHLVRIEKKLDHLGYNGNGENR